MHKAEVIVIQNQDQMSNSATFKQIRISKLRKILLDKIHEWNGNGRTVGNKKSIEMIIINGIFKIALPSPLHLYFWYSYSTGLF